VTAIAAEQSRRGDAFGRAIVRLRRWIVWRAGSRLLALPVALYANHHYLASDPPAPPQLPATSWAFAEQQRLLERSEERLQSIEAKGPGLATVSAIVVAAIALAVSLNWETATTLQRAVLIAAGAYATMSLVAPITLVGPIERRTVTVDQLVTAAADAAPEASLARACSEAAADIDHSVIRLSNLQAASRNDLAAATVLFLVWVASALVHC
jgi:hypothetical protein